MIKCDVNKRNPIDKIFVEAGGTIEEIADDIGNITNAIYYHLKEQDPEAAEDFKHTIQAIFADEGPAWMPREELMKED